MKKLNICLFCFFTLFLVNSCHEEREAIAEVKIINNSSYDLSIYFVIEYYYDINIEVRQNQSNYFDLAIPQWDYENYLDPNYKVRKIIFSNLDTKEKISELENSENNIFEFITVKDKKKEDWKAYFIFKVTNDLLN